MISLIQNTAGVRRAAPLTLALLLAGCAGFAPDGGMDVVASIAGDELRKRVVVVRSEADAARARAEVAQLLRRPLTADRAVQVALYNNRGLQAAYNALGMAEAAMVAASQPPAPAVSLERLAGPRELEIEKRIVANILGLAMLPARSEIAAARFRQAQLRAAEETLRLAADTRRAWYRAVTARQTASFLEQAKSAAEAATNLARRLGETGAMNKLDQAREQVFYAEITAQLARARQQAASERERLARLMGLWGADLDFRLPAALEPLPRRPLALPAVEAEAVARRVDLQIARLEVEALARSYGLTNATRFLDLAELAGIAKTIKERASGEGTRARGFELELRVPLFDFGEARSREAEQAYMRAVNRLADHAVRVRAEARDAYRSYRSSYDIARHYRDEVLPLRKIISDETLLRYNSMLIDVFALLAEARQRIASTIAAIEAQRDFWLARVALATAVAGGGASEPDPQTVAAGLETGGHQGDRP